MSSLIPVVSFPLPISFRSNFRSLFLLASGIVFNIVHMQKCPCHATEMCSTNLEMTSSVNLGSILYNILNFVLCICLPAHMSVYHTHSVSMEVRRRHRITEELWLQIFVSHHVDAGN